MNFFVKKCKIDNVSVITASVMICVLFAILAGSFALTSFNIALKIGALLAYVAVLWFADRKYHFNRLRSWLYVFVLTLLLVCFCLAVYMHK